MHFTEILSGPFVGCGGAIAGAQTRCRYGADKDPYWHLVLGSVLAKLGTFLFDKVHQSLVKKVI